MTHMPEPKRYVKLPVVIEAIEFTGERENGEAIIKWLAVNGTEMADYWVPVDDVPFLIIPTLEGRMRADVGDFIVQGVSGEFYPVKPYIFAQTYREMDDDPATPA